MTDKPAILQDTTFTVEEGIAYRISRTGAIWCNKLFFSAAVLLAIWLLYAHCAGLAACTEGRAAGNQTDVSAVEDGTCSVFLTPTAKYLGAMTVLSFLASLGFGAVGLVVGKRILEVTRTEDEVGADERDPQ